MDIRKGWYPDILIPDVVAKFCADNPLPVFKKQIEDLRLPPAPSPPEPLVIDYSRYLLIVWIWLAGLILLLISNWILGFYWSYLLLASVSELLGAVALAFVEYQKQQQRQLCYQQHLTLYCEQLVEYEYCRSELEVKLKRRQAQLQSEQFQRYQKQILWHQQQLRGLLIKKIILPAPEKGTATEGISEASFYARLKRYFPEAQQSVVFLNPNSFNYTADFIIYHRLTGLAIDCEIDEPYVLKTGKLHHCIDGDADPRRNQFFIDNNWAVIRFSERQAFLYPDSCCKAIAFLIYQITGDDTYWQKLVRYPDLEPHKQWTIREAKLLAKRKYRNSYFPAEVLASLADSKASKASKASLGKGKSKTNSRSKGRGKSPR